MASPRVLPGPSLLGPTPPPTRKPNQPNRPQVGRINQPNQQQSPNTLQHQDPRPPPGLAPPISSRGRGGRSPGRHQGGRGSGGGRSPGGGSGRGTPGASWPHPPQGTQSNWWTRANTPDALYPAEFHSATLPRHFELTLFAQEAADSFTWDCQQGDYGKRKYSSQEVLNEMRRWESDYPKSTGKSSGAKFDNKVGLLLKSSAPAESI